jgi:putative transposase
MSISDFVKEIKVESNEFMNSKGWVKGAFKWQEGYGVFSYSHSHIDRVIKYVKNQEVHHQQNSFKTEYLELLSRFAVLYEEKYVFDFLDRGAEEAPNRAE